MKRSASDKRTKSSVSDVSDDTKLSRSKSVKAASKSSAPLSKSSTESSIKSPEPPLAMSTPLFLVPDPNNDDNNAEGEKVKDANEQGTKEQDLQRFIKLLDSA